MPWSPLGQGFLTGALAADIRFDSTDVRSRFPRFTAQAMQANLALVDLLTDIALRKNATPAQIAQMPWIVPIPGTGKLHRLEENLGAAALDLTPGDLREIDTATSTIEVLGARGSGQEQYR